MKTCVLMPTFNEREVIRSSVTRLFAEQPEIDLIIIDDSSPDGTGVLADQIAAQDSRVSVIHRTNKEGLGKAYAQGYQTALNRGYQRIVQMDADGSHQPKDLAKLLARTEDLVIGSRWVSGGEVKNWPGHRIWISTTGNAYARFAIGTKIRDVTAGYRVYTAALLEKLPTNQIRARGYGFQVEMTKWTLAAGGEVSEVPISFLEREGGKSKMTFGIIWEAFILCTGWLVERLLRR